MLIPISANDTVFVLDMPGRPLAKCLVVKVEDYHVTVARMGYPATRISRFRVYAKHFGDGCCKVCGCPASWPYRRRNPHGEIVEGCIAAAHDVIPVDVTGREDDRAWHDRPAAARARGELAAMLGGG